MQTAKIFMNGRSQAVRLPKDCRFAEKEVYVRRFDDIVVLFPKTDPWGPLVESLDKFSEDFMESRTQGNQQDRKRL